MILFVGFDCILFDNDCLFLILLTYVYNFNESQSNIKFKWNILEFFYNNKEQRINSIMYYVFLA